MSWLDEQSLVILFIYHPSLQVKAANTRSREESRVGVSIVRRHIQTERGRVEAEMRTPASVGVMATLVDV